MLVGVLALQGDFKEHMTSLVKAGVQGREVRDKGDLKMVEALILPGGESTTMAKLLVSTGLDEAIRVRVQGGMPIWGTCAGAILLAKGLSKGEPLETQLGLMDIEVERNAFGRQTESFVADLKIPGGKQRAFFIRAPQVSRLGRRVKVLAKYKDQPVMLRSKNVLVTTFHSELSDRDLVLQYFLKCQ